MLFRSLARELAIVRAQVPQASAQLAQQVAGFVARLRSDSFASAFVRLPGIAESVEWTQALVALQAAQITPDVVQETSGVLFKQQEDVLSLQQRLPELLAS